MSYLAENVVYEGDWTDYTHPEYKITQSQKAQRSYHAQEYPVYEIDQNIFVFTGEIRYASFPYHTLFVVYNGNGTYELYNKRT
jgi:hypothetical protein